MNSGKDPGSDWSAVVLLCTAVFIQILLQIRRALLEQGIIEPLLQVILVAQFCKLTQSVRGLMDAEEVGDEILFKMARIFQCQKKYDRALDKYHEVCDSVASKIRAAPDYPADYHLLSLALSKAVELYRMRGDSVKALALIKVEGGFLELLEDHPPNSVLPQSNLLLLLDQMDTAFSQLTDPAQILDHLYQERIRKDAAHAKKNRDTILRAAQRQKSQREHSRFLRACDWAEKHILELILVITASLILLVLIILLCLGIGLRHKTGEGQTRPKERRKAFVQSAGRQSQGVGRQRLRTKKNRTNHW
jgi:hypothetical protein